MDYLNKKILLIFQFNFSSLPNLAHCDFVTLPSKKQLLPLLYISVIFLPDHLQFIS